MGKPTVKGTMSEQANQVKHINAVARLQKHLASYVSDPSHVTVREDIFIDDMIYLLGISCDEPKFAGSLGYSQFKQLVKKVIG
jgi:hypothetical protein